MNKNNRRVFHLKIAVVGVLFSIAFASKIAAQSDVIEPFNLEDHESLLMKFFDSDSISDNEEVLWTPLTFSDLLSSNVSSDGFVHTALDTIMYFDVSGVKKAVALFETLAYQNGAIADCQSCGAQISAAVFEDAGDGKYQVTKFFKHFTTQGSYGLNGESGLIQFGQEEWCLSLQMAWMGEGIYGEYITFYNLESFEKVFNFTTHEDNMGVFEAGSDRSYAFDESLHFLPGVETESGWWDFDIVQRGTKKDPDVERAVPANEVIRYEFDWDTSTYLKSCK